MERTFEAMGRRLEIERVGMRVDLEMVLRG